MTSIPGRVFATLRVWLGLNDPSANRLHPAHGWLLPPSRLEPQVARAAANRGLAGAGLAGRPE
jgi:hypothetical protein